MKIVNEDVRRSSAPVIYEDSVRIEGAVRTGAHLMVHGDVTVHGNVEDALIEADGCISIAGGFLGTGRGIATCKGDFRARFVQGQRIEAGGSVEIANAIVSSTVFARGDIKTGRDEGALVGGEIHAYGNVETAVLGSRRPVMTRIGVGVDPLLAMRIEGLEREAMELTRKRIGFLKNMAAAERLPESNSDSALIADMQAAADGIQGDIIAACEEIMELRKLTNLNKHAVVVVTKASYPPLEISVCFSRLTHDAVTGPVVFRPLEDRVILDTWSAE